MHETSHAHLHIDPPFAGLRGGTLVDGWLVAKPGRHFADLRVRAGALTFPGVYGIPRRDLAEFFQSTSPHLLAGFSVTLNLPVGRHHLAIEACTLDGEWMEVATLEREITPAEALPDPEARRPLDAAAVGFLLRGALRRSDGPRRHPAETARAWVQATPARHHLRHPPRPFFGHLDQPRIWDRATFGRLAISGWIYHASQPIVRVFATTDLQVTQDLAYGRETPFLADAATGGAARAAGYDGFIDLPAQLPRPAVVRVYAELADGSWHLGSVARFNVLDHEEAKRPFVDGSAVTFLRTWRGLVGAIRRRNWQVPGGPDYRRELGAVWREFRTLAPRPRRTRPNAPVVARPGGPIVLVSHNLKREGAPLFLLEYARGLAAQGKGDLVVVAAEGGPLHDDFAALGATVRLVDLSGLDRATTVSGFRSAIAGVGDSLDLAGSSLVVANTLSSHWAVPVARRAGRPVLLCIHESSPPRAFFRHRFPDPIIQEIETALRLADRVTFLTASTRAYYADLSDGRNYAINPGWIDVVAIDRFRTEHARPDLRRQLGVPADRRLVINVGTVCERKGQHVFARSVDLLARLDPELAAGADFVMIGARASAHDQRLRDFVAGLGRPNLRIVPETEDTGSWYGAADLFVCTSFEESFPRVVLEAMAFKVPIVASSVHGVPEMVRPGIEAVLVAPGDTWALAAAMRRHLAAPAAGRAMAERARERVIAEYEWRRVLPRHLRQMSGLLAGPAFATPP